MTDQGKTNKFVQNDPMETNEERIFRIYRSIKMDCKLRGTINDPNMVEITIKKLQPKPDKFKFVVVGKEDDVYLSCKPGFIPNLNVRGGAERCGIGEELTRLCLIESRIHDTANDPENKAMKKLQDEELKSFMKWAKSKCSKLLYLEMVTIPKDAGFLYFKSALAAGYTEMFVSLGNKVTYPRKGPCPVAKLKDRYDQNGHMNDGTNSVLVWGNSWFFCSPKKLTVENKCTIL